MKNNRREFLKLTGMAGISLAGAGIIDCTGQPTNQAYREQPRQTHNQKFNMSGFAAPKLDTVRIGNIGIGNRGSYALDRLIRIEGVDIKAICDVIPDRVGASSLERFKNSSHKPDTYSGKEDEWKKVCDRDDIDLIYITTPWRLHTPMAVYAMEHGKHAVIEVPAATTIDECWQLVETSEKTRKHCMMLEDCCYDDFEMLTLNMARQGFFGDIVHCEGAYFNWYSFNPKNKTHTWSQKESIFRNGNLYPTHGLGPICQIMDINRGDKMDYMVSVSSNDFTMRDLYNKAAANDEFWKPFAEQANKTHCGNINTSTIRTNKGRTIMVQYDITSPQVYSRIHKVSGTKAAALKYPLPAKISVGKNWITPEEYKILEEKYTPEIAKRLAYMGTQVVGHGDGSVVMDWRLIDCLRNGLPLDQDVYDAALWSSIGPLSEWSVANRSNSIDVPDFTGGSWKTNQPIDILLEKGGTTKVLR